jgi:hypothetical protein
VALEIEGSNPSTHPISPAPIAQRTEHRSSDLKPDIPSGAVSFKLELLCQLPEPRFEAEVPFGDVLSFLVCRLFVANF